MIALFIFSFKEARCLWWAKETGGIPFHPQSATVVLLNINFHPGIGSGHSPWLAPYIRMEYDIQLFCTMNACEGQACGIGFVKIELRCWGGPPPGESKSPCFTGRTGAATWWLPVPHLWEQAAVALGKRDGEALSWGTDLMEAQECVRKLKTWLLPRGRYEPGVLKDNLNSGVSS